MTSEQRLAAAARYRLSFVSIALFCASAGVDPTAVVRWSAVREAMSRAICAAPDEASPTRYQLFLGDRENCGAPPSATPLEKAVDTALRQATPFLAPVFPIVAFDPTGVAEALAAIDDGRERQRVVAAAVLEDAWARRVLIPRLGRALASHNILCEDCPTLSAEPIDLSWAEFAPYVSAFVQLDPSGSSFHICGGSDAAQRLPSTDPLRVRLGWYAAQNALSVADRTIFHWDAILREYGPEPDQLQRRLSARLNGDPIIREAVCKVLAASASDLLRVTDCSNEQSLAESADDGH